MTPDINIFRIMQPKSQIYGDNLHQVRELAKDYEVVNCFQNHYL